MNIQCSSKQVKRTHRSIKREGGWEFRYNQHRYYINPVLMSRKTAELPIRGHRIYLNMSEPCKLSLAFCCRGLSDGKLCPYMASIRFIQGCSQNYITSDWTKYSCLRLIRVNCSCSSTFLKCTIYLTVRSRAVKSKRSNRHHCIVVIKKSFLLLSITNTENVNNNSGYLCLCLSRSLSVSLSLSLSVFPLLLPPFTLPPN